MTTFTYEDLTKVARGTKHYEILNFPGKGDVANTKIGIKILSQAEIDIAYQLSEQKIALRDLGEDLEKILKRTNKDLTSSALNKELERQLIYRAVIQVPTEEEIEAGKYTKFFPDAESVGNLSVDEVSAIMQAYNNIQEKYSPSYTIKTDTDFEELVEEVKKKSARGLYLNSLELEMLLDFLVAHPEILLKDNGLLSLPSNHLEKKQKKLQ